MSAISETVLEIKDLKTYFYVRGGELRALDGLSYTVKKRGMRSTGRRKRLRQNNHGALRFANVQD